MTYVKKPRNNFTHTLRRMANQTAIRSFFITHPGCSQKECAHHLNLFPGTVKRHIAEIRKEWK